MIGAAEEFLETNIVLWIDKNRILDLICFILTSDKSTISIHSRTTCFIFPLTFLLFALSPFEAKMCEHDDPEDPEIETAGQHSEGGREGCQWLLVEEGVEGSGGEGEDALEEWEDGEGSAHLLTVQQLGQVGPVRRGGDIQAFEMNFE